MVVLAEVKYESRADEGANAIMFFLFARFDFPEPIILCRRAIHPCELKRVEEDSLFVLAEAVVSATSSGGIGSLGG